MQLEVIMISGPQGSGKSTLSRKIAREIQEMQIQSWGVEETTFAAPLYEMHHACRQLLRKYGFEPPHPIKDGNLLQLLGTDWARNTLSKDIWVLLLRNKIDQLIEAHAKFGHRRLTVIVSDCRFRNEFHAFNEALRIRLKCDLETRKRRCEMWRDKSDHQSETDLDMYERTHQFDAVFDTGAMLPDQIADEVLEMLLDGDWIEERSPEPTPTEN